MLSRQDFVGLVLAPLLEQAVTPPSDFYLQLFAVLADDVLAHKLIKSGGGKRSSAYAQREFRMLAKLQALISQVHLTRSRMEKYLPWTIIKMTLKRNFRFTIERELECK